MPRCYKRKAVSLWGLWTEDNLNNAMRAARNGTSIGVAAQNCEKIIFLKGVWIGDLSGKQNELKLVKHLKGMQKSGFPLTIYDVRRV